MKKILFFSILLCSFVCFSSTKSHACTSNTSTPVGNFDQTYFPATNVPQNFRVVLADLFAQVSERVEWDLETSPGQSEDLQFELENSFVVGIESSQIEVKTWKPTQQLEMGNRIRQKNCPGCEWQTIEAPDRTAPPKPELTILDYHTFPDLSDDCRFGMLGALQVGVAPREGAPEPSLLVLIYVGDTPEMAQTSTKPLIFDELRSDADMIPLYVNEKLEEVAPESGFCFAMEFLDHAHNRSPRSEPLCWEAPERPPVENPMDEPDPWMEPAPDMGPQHDMSRMEATGDMMSSDDTNAPDDQPEPTCTTTWAPSQPTPIWLFFLLGLIGLRQRQPRCRTTR